jgi:hypothetical protein
MGRQPIEIDREKVRAAIRRLGNEQVFYMLDEAIDLLSPDKLHKIVKKYLSLKQLSSDSKKTTKSNLLADVKEFAKKSLAGEYYESFNVNSRNYMEMSKGTTAWIAECCRLLNRCMAQGKKGDTSEIRQAFDLIFGLLRYIDECHDDVIFFADEGGSWQVGVDWDKVLPPWFKVLSATATPVEYAERITALLENHYNYGRYKMLAIAHKIATPDQRKALAKVVDRQASGQQRGAKP